MVLYRPLAANRLRNGIKSALGLRNEGEDARESERAPIIIPATLRGSGIEDTLAFITNISAAGAALNVENSIPTSSIQTIEFCLPGTNENFTAGVEPVWRDVQGRMGLRFAGVSSAFSEGLKKWLASHPASQRVAKAGA